MTERAVRIGAVGCGVVATAYYFPFIKDYDKADLVAVCDEREVRARESARLFGVSEIYTDYDEMLAKRDIDAVFILKPTRLLQRYAKPV